MVPRLSSVTLAIATIAAGSFATIGCSDGPSAGDNPGRDLSIGSDNTGAVEAALSRDRPGGGKLPRAAGPRTGVIHIVTVDVPNGYYLDRLVRGGFDIAGRKRNRVTIYATTQELSRLEKEGFRPVVVDQYTRPRKGPSHLFGKTMGVYHTIDTLKQDLTKFAMMYPTLTHLESMGKSVEGRDLWAMKLTDNPTVQEDEPEVIYVSTMHGDEITGVELCMYFIEMLLQGYGSDPRVTNLLNTTELWIVPLMNPDGFVSGDRYNATGYDLNRSFPEGADTPLGNILSGPPMNFAGHPTEVVLMMQWRAAHSFTLAANYHGGALLVNYPYDNDGNGSVYSPSPDDDLFVFISKAYSSHNLPMWNSWEFDDGITNGAAWYAIDGGMQDWNYRYLGTNEVTIEVSEDKGPPSSQLKTFWGDNQESMLSYTETVHLGIRGVITDSATGAPVFGSVQLTGNSHLVFSDPQVGDYHRQALAGTYTLTFAAPGYQSKIVSNVVVGEASSVRVDVSLNKN